MTRYGVAVIGGGPAGATTALGLARHGHSVLLLERSAYEHRPVGDVLWGDASELLRGVGAWDGPDERVHSACHAIFSAWGGAELSVNDMTFKPIGSSYHLDRNRFDAQLACATEEAGVAVLRSARPVAVTRGSDCWRIVVEQGGDRQTVEVPFLVDASGRGGGVARKLGARWIAYDQLIGLVGVAVPQTQERMLDGPVLLIESFEDGWWYSVPSPDGSLVGACMTDPEVLAESGLDPTDFWTEQLRRCPHTAERFQGYGLKGPVHGRNAGTGRLDPVAGPGWIAVGDAGSGYDCLTGAGVKKAALMSLKAVESLGQNGADNSVVLDDYAAWVVDAFEGYLDDRAWFYRQEVRWPGSAFWSRRHSDPAPMLERRAASQGVGE